MKDCCHKKSFSRGLLLGLLPHSFCIAFIIFSLIGSTLAVSFFKQYLLTPYFFEILVGLSFVFAGISAVIYLKKRERLSMRGIRENWGYLGILFGTTITINLLLFLVIFPAVANLNSAKNSHNLIAQTNNFKTITLEVKVPCSGHAPLIIDELKKDDGVVSVKFSLPNIFEVYYDPQKTDFGKILQLEIFKSFPATVK